MALIKSLVVKLGLDTAHFECGTKRAKKSTKGLHSQLGQLNKMVKLAAGAMAAFYAVRGAATWARETMNSIDAIGKMSDELAISTEALVGLGHAARISGTDMQAMQKGLQLMERGLGEASANLGQAKYGLEMLGLDYKELIRLAPEETFLRIADSISKLPSVYQRATAASWIFGRSGKQLMNLFLQGRIGIEAMMVEAKRLGLTYSRFDASRVEEANDAITRMEDAWKGVSQQLIIGVAPYVTAIVDSFTDLGVQGVKAGNLANTAFGGLATTILTAAGALDVLMAGFYKTQLFLAKSMAGWEIAGNMFLELPGYISPIAPWIKKLVGDKELMDFQGVVDELEAEFDDFLVGKGVGEKVAAWIEKVRKAAADAMAAGPGAPGAGGAGDAGMNAAKAVDKLTQAFQRQIDTFGMVSRAAKLYQLEKLGMGEEDRRHLQELIREIDALEHSAKLRAEGAKLFESTRTPLERYSSTIGDLDSLLKAGAITWDTYGRAVRNARRELEGGVGSARAMVFDAALMDVRGLVDARGAAGAAAGNDPRNQMLKAIEENTRMMAHGGVVV